jgi:CMP/dCMP kinase
MGHVVTIGRQFGSGGHEVGRRLAKRLGIPFYDKELITLTAEQSRFAESYLEKMDEQKPSLLNMGSAGLVPSAGVAMSREVVMNQFYNLSPNDQVFLEKSKVIQALAEKGSCVIVGRCADYVLRDYDTVNFFIQADLEDRISRKLALEEHAEHDRASMEKLIKSTDKSRSKYYEYYTHKVWGNASNYDLCINTSAIGIDGAVEVLLKFIEEFKKKTIMPDK